MGEQKSLERLAVRDYIRVSVGGRGSRVISGVGIGTQ
jgi:hypothetical protein